MAIDLTRQLVARWPDPEPAHFALLRQAGVEAVVVPHSDAGISTPLTEAASAAGIAIAPDAILSGAAVAGGAWPGIRRPGKPQNWDNDLFASPSAEPWIDSNSYLVPLERVLTGQPSPVVAYEAGPATGLPADRSVPFESLEVALIEARLQGGNYVLSIEPRYRAALLSGDSRALAAWASLGRTAAWLRREARLFGLASPPTLTALVEAGRPTAEIANLLYRRNASPCLALASSPPPPDPARILLLVAASLGAAPGEAVWRHAEAGSTVAIDSAESVRPSWRRLKQEPDRDIFAVGAGRVVAYRKRVADPSEFALDMIDLIGHRQRTARLWNAQAAVVFATAGPAPGEALLHAVNYGAAQSEEVQARIHGHFREATLLCPEAPPASLKTQTRGLATEVFLPKLSRVAVVRFRA